MTVTVSVNDTRLGWSNPNQYNPDCGGVNSLTRDETVSLNFTGESPSFIRQTLQLMLFLLKAPPSQSTSS